jgi:hypothetical protein
MAANWILPSYVCWGLHFEEQAVTYLGVTASGEPEPRQLFIAKFVDSNKNDQWHGYPADPGGNKQQDIPPETVLNSWLQEQYLRPSIIRKLTKGQKCKL